MRVKFPDDIKIYIACGKTDMRKAIDGLSALVSQNFKLSPFDNVLFIFCGGKRDRIKALLWEGDGFLLLYKRLEGGVFQWPRNTEEVREISPQQYRWLIEGLSIDQKKVIQKLDHKRII
ncbi:MAG: IS66 family insertion sequence element accessory protein TnpB [Tissierella sp.]|uniref:IS66 family insertion sequence element accessory protein TnpB n=1 Tax=Tissierella sp. TaxID=41274 RepID=UPI003F9CE90C